MKGRRILSGHSALLVLALGAPATTQEQKGGGAPASVSQLEAAVKRDPGSPSARVALGLAYWGRNEYPRALLEFRRAVEVGPRSAEAHNWLGVALSRKSELPAAIAEFRKAIELDPQYARAYANLGSALATSGDYGEAVEVFQKALALEPNSVAAHFNLGMALRETGDLETATAHLRRVAEADPTNASIHYELGQTLRQGGDLPGAVASLERALEINPELREGYYALGVTLRQQGAAVRRPPPAPASPADDLYAARPRSRRAGRSRGCPRAAHRGPPPGRRPTRTRTASSASSWVSRGSLSPPSATWSGRWPCGPSPPRPATTSGWRCGTAAARDRAIGELRRSVELDPAAGGSQAFLGTALRETGDLAGARVSLQRAIALLPPTAAVYVDLAHHLPPGRRSRQGGRTARGRAEPLRAVGARAGLGLGERRPPQGARSRARATPRPTTCSVACSAARASTAARWPPSSARRSGSSPDYAEAHNNLGLVLVQAGDDAAGHRRVPRGGADLAGLRGRPRQPGRRPHSDRRRGGRPGAREGGGPGAHPGEGAVQPGLGLRREPRPRTGQGDRGAARGHRARPDLRPGAPRARQGAPPGRQRERGDLRRSRRPCGSSPSAEKPTTSSAWPSRGRGEPAEATPGAPEGPRAGGGGRARPDREPRHRGGPLRAREGRPRAGGGQAPPRDPGPTRLIRGHELPRGGAREAGRRGRRRRRLPEGAGAQSRGRARASRASSG